MALELLLFTSANLVIIRNDSEQLKVCAKNMKKWGIIYAA